MSIWRRSLVPVVCAAAAVLLAAAVAAGLDQMATVNPRNSIATAVRLDPGNQGSLHRLVMLGLGEGSLPGGFPYDLYEEGYEEYFDERPYAPTHQGET